MQRTVPLAKARREEIEHLRISMNEQGTVEEAVEGVLGRSCAELTEGIEQKLSSPSQLERTWTHEYNATVEDQQIQILRLY